MVINKYQEQRHCTASQKMNLVNIKKITDFTQKHPQSRKSLSTWVTVAQAAKWETPSDIKNQFRSADFISGNRVIFNISGNKYRLTIQAVYNAGTLIILNIATHADYSKSLLPPPIDYP